MVNIKEKLEKGWLHCRVVIEVIGKPKEHIEKAIQESVSFVDFLRGREKYKYFFGAKESKIYSLKLKRIEKRS